MHTSELFLTFVRRLIFSFLLIMMVAVASHAQESGHVGISTREVGVFSSQSTPAHSAILPDFGFAANYLTYCNTGFTGSIDLEWSPNPSTTAYIVIAQANYSATDSLCHILQLGGYFPNLRSTVTPSAGSLSAWYTASAAPISLFGSGVGSSGQTSPIVCDQNLSTTVAAAGTGNLVGTIQAGQTVIICNAVVSFASAPTTGSALIEWSAAVGCTSPIDASWQAYTSATTPVYITVPLSQRSPSSATLPYPCFVNNSGVSAIVSVSYARVYSL